MGLSTALPTTFKAGTTTYSCFFGRLDVGDPILPFVCLPWMIGLENSLPVSCAEKQELESVAMQ